MAAIGGFYGGFWDTGEQEAVLGQIFQAQQDRGAVLSGKAWGNQTGVAAGGMAQNHLSARKEPEANECFWEWRSLERRAAVFLDGEFYNSRELRTELKALGEDLETDGDAELAGRMYLHYGPEFVKQLNGVFAMAVVDFNKKMVFLYRDRIGVKPLFYTFWKDRLYFASRLKGLLACPGIRPEVDREGLNEIFSIGPARTPGNGVLKGIFELEPARMMIAAPDGCRQMEWWGLESRPHEDSYDTTVEKVRELVIDAVTRQAVAKEPLCAFLSGGLDSSLVSAVCVSLAEEKGQRLDTFSFDFTDNGKYFKANAFQPSQDHPYVEQMADFLNSQHHCLECSSRQLADLLEDSVRAADLPVMGDIDSSLLYFCRQTARYCGIAVTGECADEIFGGYPWFHKKEMLNADTFPWTRDLDARKVLLKEDFLQELGMEQYVEKRYRETLERVPQCPEESPEKLRQRQMAWLNLKWFMQTLLNRMDRTSSSAGLRARVPFADYRIVEYLWNVPWEMKAKNGEVKHLLREIAKGILPEEVRTRKKSPYPKTYVPYYEEILAERMREMLEDSKRPGAELLDREKTMRFLRKPSDYGRPWYGQLMAAPQMMAYMLQVDCWLREYDIKIRV